MTTPRPNPRLGVTGTRNRHKSDSYSEINTTAILTIPLDRNETVFNSAPREQHTSQCVATSATASVPTVANPQHHTTKPFQPRLQLTEGNQ